MTTRAVARALGVALVTLAACSGLAGLDDLTFREPSAEEELCTPGSQRACYTGPAGTEGVGACVEGVAFCRDDGQGYSACAGEVLPGQEDCSAPGDEDCSGQANDGCPCVEGTSIPCYEGPAGTENVGSCVAGLQTCLAGGTSYGPCQGQVLPGTELCSTSADEDCDAVPECGAVVDGAVFGDVGPQAILGLGAGPTGEVGLAGQFEGQLGFGADMLVGSAPGDAYGVLRLAPATFGFAGAYGSDPTPELAWDAAVGAGDALVLVGSAAGTVDFGTGTLTPAGLGTTSDAFVAQVGGSQNTAWATLLGDAADQLAHGAALGPNGELFVVGDNNGTLVFGADTLDASSTDAFLVAWDAAKKPLFANAFGGNKLQRALAVAVDSAARPAVVGYAQEVLDIDGVPTLLSGNNNTAYLVTRTAAGGARWMVHGTSFGGSSVASAVAVGAVGDIVIAGNFQGDLSLGPCDLAGQLGNTDAFVAAFSPQGECTFARSFGGVGDQDASGVAFGDDGSVYVTGSFKGATDFGDGNLVGPNGRDGFVVKLDATGTFVWVTVLGGSGDTFPNDLVWSTAGHVVVGGAWSGALDWGAGPMDSVGDLDAFLVELAP